MQKLNHYFYIDVTNQNQTVNLYCKEPYQQSEIELTDKNVLSFLNEQKITHGINHATVQVLTTKPSPDEFPFIIANGTPVEHGKNGNITYKSNIGVEKIQDQNTNFRDIMKLPMVEKGQQLATIIEPKAGTNGQNVYGKTVTAKPGKPCPVKAGNNVVFREENHSFYAAVTGQFIVSDKKVNVEKVYEIHETLSMKSGNIDFNGSITIHGNVPTGYKVQAKEDINVFGIVEGATLIAGGSIFITEGMAGLQKGLLQAKKNIHIGYLNQGNITAEGSVHVENSMVHSKCVATEHVYLKHGNIIGGSVSAGKSIEAKDVGNRMNTKTNIMFGMNESIHKKENELLEQKKELELSLKKLIAIGDKLDIDKGIPDAKKRNLLLKQRNSFLKTSEAIQDVDTKLNNLYAAIANEYEAVLKINGRLHENTRITFGKYKRNIHAPRDQVKLLLLDKEIIIQNLTSF